MLKLIKAKGLVDVDNGLVAPNAFVIVENGKIGAVGSQADLGSFDMEPEIIDLSDRYILPGLINSHVHLCMPGEIGTSSHAFSRETDSIWLLTAAQNARKALMSGVTTVRDCGDRNGLVFQLRRAIEKGTVEGCGIVQSGTYLTVTGGHCHYEGGEVDGCDDMVKAVRRTFKNGADFIKIMATGGGTPGTYPEYASFSVDELKAATETAHRIGKSVAAHCRGIPGIRNAIAAGIDQIEHCCFEKPGLVLECDHQMAEQIAEAGVIVTPTIQLYRDMADALRRKQEQGALTAQEEKELDLRSRRAEEKLKSYQGLLAAGVTCVAGDDAGLPLTPIGNLWLELKAMTDGGMSATQAIVAATRTAAEAMGKSDQIGSIAMGKQADIIGVDSDPSQDITALAKPSFIMRAGRTYLT